MSFSAQLPPSPVSAAFHGLQWDPLDKLRLSKEEKLLLRSAEANPIDYTLSSRERAATFRKLLLKVIGEASGPSGPSHVSHLKTQLPDNEALQMLCVDAMGVILHYAIAQLYEVVVCLREKKASASMTIATTFYNESNGFLNDDWRALLRVLHLGGGGDAFAQSGAAICLAYILMAGCPSQKASNSVLKTSYSSVKEPLNGLISWVASRLQSSSASSISLVSPTLMVLMSCPEARHMFASSGGIGYLSRHLHLNNSSASLPSKARRRSKAVGMTVQQLYELTFCLWYVPQIILTRSLSLFQRLV